MRPADRPGTWGGALAALAAAGVGLATSFGVHITAQQHDAILTFTGAAALAAPLVGALFDHASIRARSASHVAEKIATYVQPPGPPEAP